MTAAERGLLLLLAEWMPDMIPPGPRAIDKARLKALAELVAAIQAEELVA